MKKYWKHLLCILLVGAMLCATLPVSMAADKPEAPDYALADEIFEGLYDMLGQRKSLMSDTMRAELVERYLGFADGVLHSSIHRTGNALFWQTEDGVTCHYSPHLYELMTGTEDRPTGADLSVLSADDLPEIDKLPLPASKSTSEQARDVYLIAPYYGIDAEFQGEGGTYDRWAGIVARFTGGKAYRMTQNSVTVESLARTLENSALVFIDSHGDTDTGDEDCHTSYICIQSGAGLTSADYAFDSGIGASHACYGGTANGGRMSYYEVDGTVIARRMTKNAPNNMIWNGACFGMSSSGFCSPLRNKGVGVVYGYSNAVSFGGDLCWMDTAMDALTDGKTVAQAIDAMRSTWGSWDYSRAICQANHWSLNWVNSSAQEAVFHDDAFPVVASANDAFPADPNSVQTVRCDWKLPQIPLTARFHVPDGVKCPDVNCYVFYRGSLPEPQGTPRCTDRPYNFIGWCLRPVNDTTSRPSQIFYSGDRYSFGYDAPDDPLSFGQTDADIYALYSYSGGGKIHYTTQAPDGPDDPFDPSRLFDDMPYGTWYYNNVRYAVAEGLVNGYTDGTFRPMATLKRSEVVSVLYRAAGSPSVSINTSFVDVPPTAWDAPAISWAVQNGIAQGCTDTTFCPDLSVTRIQLAVFFYRFAGATSTSTAVLNSFPDRAQVPSWAAKELAWAVEHGLINGSRVGGQDYLQPLNEATRAQFVAILQRYLEN